MKIEIPKKIEKTLYVHVGIGKHNSGEISIYDFVCKEPEQGSFPTTKLFSFDVSMDIPENVTIDSISNRLIEVLAEKKKSIQAEYHVKLKAVEEEIQSLLAIENKGGQ